MCAFSNNSSSHPSSDQKAPPHYLGHRARVREKFQKTKGEGWLDYEILELFLFFLIPHKDTKPIAKALLQKFGTFEAIGMAEPKALQEIDGIGPTTAMAFNVYGEMIRRQARQKIQHLPLLDSWKAVLEYCRIQEGHSPVEVLHVLFLNIKNYLISDEILSSGSVSEALFPIRDILRRALEIQASALILVHNHPSGDPMPSHADIDATRQLAAATQIFKIRLLDHLIITASSYTSLHDLGVF